MRAKNRLSPYPILSAYSDDYKTGSFNSTFQVNNDYGHLNIQVEYHLDSNFLQTLIDIQKAKFVTHIECPKTSFRQKVADDKSLISVAIPLEKVTDTVEVNTFIVANGDFPYMSSEFNDEYDGFQFEIKKNQILAVGGAAKITVANNTKDFETFPSLIKIVKVDTAEKAMSVDTDSDLIKIKLSAKVCEAYKTVGNSSMRNTAFSLVIFPAMMVVLARMINGKETYLSDYRWFTVLEKKLESKGIPLDSLSVDDGSMIDACQKIFDDPIARAFDEMLTVSGGMYED